MEKLNGFLDEQNKEIKKLQAKTYKSYFDAIITGKEEFYKEYEKSAMEMEDFFHSKENFEKIRKDAFKSLPKKVKKKLKNE